MPEHNLYDELRELRRAMVTEADGTKRYRLIDDFSQSSMADAAVDMVSHLLRPFVPYKPTSHRMLNSCYDADFDAKSHTLMDYPTVVSAKMGGPWDNYNYLLSAHVSGCPLHCWHCYVDECLTRACGRCPLEEAGACKLYGRGGEPNTTATQLVDQFLMQRDAHKRDAGKPKANILRITGGEPLLVPDLIHECLAILESRNLEDEVFLWTETSLVPLLTNPTTGLAFAEEWGLDLKQLSQHRNFCIHPCLHGLDSETMRSVAGHGVEIADLLSGLQRLLDAGVDIYPSFISEAVPPESIAPAFEKLKQLDRNLPLRFALIRGDSYGPVTDRLEAFSKVGRKAPVQYSHSQAVEIWDRLLRDNYHLPYGSIPRHVVPLRSQVAPCVLDDSADTNALMFFKSAYRPEYVDALMRVVSLPIGWEFSAAYLLRHLAPNLAAQIKHGAKMAERKVVFVFADDEAKPKTAGWARRFRPLREAILTRVDYRDGSTWAEFHFRLGAMLRPKLTWEASSDEIASRFMSGVLPNESRAFYVLPSTELLWSSADASTLIGDWESVVETLSRFQKLAAAPFLTLESVRTTSDRFVSLREPIALKAGESYVVTLRSFAPNITRVHEQFGSTVTIECRTSSSKINVLTPPGMLFSVHGQHEVSLECSTSGSDLRASLSAEVVGEKARSGPILHLKVCARGRKAMAALALFGVALGIFATFVPELMPDLYKGEPAMFLKLGGAALTPLCLVLLTQIYREQ